MWLISSCISRSWIWDTISRCNLVWSTGLVFNQHACAFLDTLYQVCNGATGGYSGLLRRNKALCDNRSMGFDCNCNNRIGSTLQYQLFAEHPISCLHHSMQGKHAECGHMITICQLCSLLATTTMQWIHTSTWHPTSPMKWRFSNQLIEANNTEKNILISCNHNDN